MSLPWIRTKFKMASKMEYAGKQNIMPLTALSTCTDAFHKEFFKQISSCCYEKKLSNTLKVCIKLFRPFKKRSKIQNVSYAYCMGHF